MIKEFETALQIKKKRDFSKRMKEVKKYAEDNKDRIMMDYLEALEDSFCINQNNTEKLNQFLDETIPILDNLIEKYKNLEKNDDLDY